ncbi:hypothetical protein [Corynebacterium macginleyi]|uniref:Uncharacterized protein n=1 Tax=Corynebacterium macginleyi TaxID=38290 RepID=A0ABS1Y4M2_9CORY|nr:hypothetical protein [Corynebacterium macginleyi]MBK4151383.1 hypothetical protein [Corynebacterium macginleyi]MBK4162309.1 hypothetical protein [Corynebacterium macginleyi]MBM0243322.1 hypothetical protein [Corynebacterium macginleyi]QRJ58414.1 hypothetical protein GWO64_003235 [Corynebacterium macginleyi]QRJ60549.1 hypothetical protein GWO70_003090 [Corynebacterium macginleyi]
MTVTPKPSTSAMVLAHRGCVGNLQFPGALKQLTAVVISAALDLIGVILPG